MDDEQLLPQRRLAELARVESWLPLRARAVGLLQPVACLPRRQGGALSLYRSFDVLLLKVAQLVLEAGGHLPDVLPLAHRLQGLDDQARRALLERACFMRWPHTNAWACFDDPGDVPELQGALVVRLAGALQ